MAEAYRLLSKASEVNSRFARTDEWCTCMTHTLSAFSEVRAGMVVFRRVIGLYGDAVTTRFGLRSRGARTPLPGPVQLVGISTVSTMYTVALAVCTLPQTTLASLTLYAMPLPEDFTLPPSTVGKEPVASSAGVSRFGTT